LSLVEAARELACGNQSSHLIFWEWNSTCARSTRWYNYHLRRARSNIVQKWAMEWKLFVPRDHLLYVLPCVTSTHQGYRAGCLTSHILCGEPAAEAPIGGRQVGERLEQTSGYWLRSETHYRVEHTLRMKLCTLHGEVLRSGSLSSGVESMYFVAAMEPVLAEIGVAGKVCFVLSVLSGAQ